jgi:hypothetical protein
MKELKEAILTALEADSTLTGLATGGVWHRLAPEGTATPFVVFFQQSGVPAYTNGGLSTKQFVYNVKAIAEGFDDGPASDIDAAFERILTDGALEQLALANGAGTVLSCRRDSDIDYPEEDKPGRYLQHKGGSFRIFVAP